MATKQRDPDIDGWISDRDAQENFNDSFRNCKIINHNDEFKFLPSFNI